MTTASSRVRNTGRGRPSKGAGVDLKEAILDSAEGLFARHGFYGVTTRQVAAEAGVDTALTGGQGWKNWFALVAQINITPAWGGEVMHRFFDPVVRQLVETLGKALPEADLPDLYWCYQFLTGSMMLPSPRPAASTSCR